MERQNTTTFQEDLDEVLRHHVGPEKKYASKSDVAKAAGISKSNLTRYVTPGQAKQPRAEILSKLSSTLGYPEDYLYNLWAYCNGLTDTHPDEIVDIKKVTEDISYNVPRRIPIFSPQCAEFVNWAEGKYPMDRADEYEPVIGTDPDAFYVRASGDSMTGSVSEKQTILEEDLLLVEPGRQVEDGDIAFCPHEGGTVRKYRRTRGGQIRLLPLNDKHETIVVKKKEPCHCFAVTEIKRKLTGS